jgi:ferredoxin--NADP+ reductase
LRDVGVARVPDRMQIGDAARPLRVAIIGSGPSGFYAAEHLQAAGLAVEIDMYDRLPTPFGLVRGGVAPDHDKIKSVTRIYDKIAGQDSFRFFGNVEFGRDVDHDDLRDLYHAVIYATGSRKARRLGIPGEDLVGSHPAPAFVGWYNGHPDFVRWSFDLSSERAIVVGVGNVAMDVARILAQSPEALARTDIAGHALDALRASKIRHVLVLGRRGPAQSAFTPKELKELGALEGVDIVVDPAELVLDPASKAELATSDRARKNLEHLAAYAARPRSGAERVIEFRFLRSPVEILGTGSVTGVRLAKNTLVEGGEGSLRTKATGETEEIDCGLILRAVGYLGAALPGVPFDASAGVIPNDAGRITDRDEQVIGEYVAGWIKRGPTGIIGTNKPDAAETVESLIADAKAGRVWEPSAASRAEAEARLWHNRPAHTTYADWQLLDELEKRRGEEVGATRRKFTRVSDMLDALAEAKEGTSRPAR